MVEVVLGSEKDLRTAPPKKFKLRTKWRLDETSSVHLFATTAGKPDRENTYELPPPVDHELYFGSLLLVKMKNGAEASLTIDEWKKAYKVLFGGFESLSKDKEDDRRERAEELTDRELQRLHPEKFNHGYLLDDFVVADDVVD